MYSQESVLVCILASPVSGYVSLGWSLNPESPEFITPFYVYGMAFVYKFVCNWSSVAVCSLGSDTRGHALFFKI